MLQSLPLSLAVSLRGLIKSNVQPQANEEEKMRWRVEEKCKFTVQIGYFYILAKKLYFNGHFRKYLSCHIGENFQSLRDFDEIFSTYSYLVKTFVDRTDVFY